MVVREKIQKLDSKGFKQARFSENYEYILDSNSKIVEFDDPRIVYIEPAPRNHYGIRLIENFYKINGKKIRFAGDTDPDTIQYAKRICSGRECLPTMSIAGAILKDIYENRGKNEISIYRNPLDQISPCQNGGWPAIWDIFAKRLKVENAILCAALNRDQNYMGLNHRKFLLAQVLLYILGHIITEARNALQCVAKNTDEALKAFEKATDNFIGKVKDLKKTLKLGLKEWSKEISKIPLKSSVEEIPKVLIFGGLNLLFTHYPLEEYFLNNGIIPKVVDLTEATRWILYASSIMSYRFEKGILSPKKQLSLIGLIFSYIFRKNRREAFNALYGRLSMIIVDSNVKMYRKIMGETGLLFDEDIPFKTFIEESHQYASWFTFTETSPTTGRFLQSIKSGFYDGLVNLGSFNCQPAMNSQAIIRPLANKSDMPYAALDCEGPWISTNQLRLIETIAVQAKRMRKKKNNLRNKNKKNYS